MTARRVALLADVHGNAPALAAVLRDVESQQVDLLVHAGDLTWGPLVEETLALIRAYDGPAAFVRGNADRAVIELADGKVVEITRLAHDEFLSKPVDMAQLLEKIRQRLAQPA